MIPIHARNYCFLHTDIAQSKLQNPAVKQDKLLGRHMGWSGHSLIPMELFLKAEFCLESVVSSK